MQAMVSIVGWTGWIKSPRIPTSLQMTPAACHLVASKQEDGSRVAQISHFFKINHVIFWCAFIFKKASNNFFFPQNPM